jgi:putative endopeptidase
LAHLHELQIPALFEIGVRPDPMESTRQTAMVGQGGLSLSSPSDYLSDSERCQQIRGYYAQHVARMFRLLGDSDEMSSSAAKTVLALETELAKVSLSLEEIVNVGFYQLTVAQLTQLLPGFDWSTYFKTVGLSDEQLGTLDVRHTRFFYHAAQMTAKVALDEWKTYLRWHLIQATAPHLSIPFATESFRFSQHLTGVKDDFSRWRRVLQAIHGVGPIHRPVAMRGIGDALGRLYGEKEFTLQTKERVLAIVNDLKNALRENIQNLPWMGPETRTAALKKLDALSVRIGYPEESRDYSRLQIRDQPHVLNVLAASVSRCKWR